MRTLQDNEIMSHTVVVYAKLQSLLHDVEKLQETGIKREFKNRIGNFHNWLESTVKELTDKFNNDASISFTEFTMKLDRLSEEFKVIISDEVQ